MDLVNATDDPFASAFFTRSSVVGDFDFAVVDFDFVGVARPPPRPPRPPRPRPPARGAGSLADERVVDVDFRRSGARDAVEGRRRALGDVALESLESRVSARLPRRVPRAMDAMGSDASTEPDVIHSSSRARR